MTVRYLCLAIKRLKDIFGGIKNLKTLRDSYILKCNLCSNFLSKASFSFTQTEDGRVKIDVRFEDESVWLTQQRMAELFQTSQQNISLHITNSYEEGELQPEATHKEYLSVHQEGSRQVQRRLTHYTST